MKVVRRLGKTPAELGNTPGVSGSPDILELDDGARCMIWALSTRAALRTSVW